MAALKFGSQCAESDMRGWHFLRQCEAIPIQEEDDRKSYAEEALRERP
jgi:hypothetical protein